MILAALVILGVPLPASAQFYCFGLTDRPATSLCTDDAEDCSVARQGTYDRGYGVTPRCTRVARAFCYTFFEDDNLVSECAQTGADCRANQASRRRANRNGSAREFTACRASTRDPVTALRQASAPRATAPSAEDSMAHCTIIPQFEHQCFASRRACESMVSSFAASDTAMHAACVPSSYVYCFQAANETRCFDGEDTCTQAGRAAHPDNPPRCYGQNRVTN